MGFLLPNRYFETGWRQPDKWLSSELLPRTALKWLIDLTIVGKTALENAVIRKRRSSHSSRLPAARPPSGNRTLRRTAGGRAETHAGARTTRSIQGMPGARGNR